MKLKNKKTGEIREIPDGFFCGDNLKKFCEEWEDVPEEPKEYWFINSVGETIRPSDTTDWEQQDATYHKEIGNYFDTREEAEKAVEKLKAWKRLKDKGYRFSKWFTRVEGGIQINMEYNKYDGIDSECRNDLDLLFGGEE